MRGGGSGLPERPVRRSVAVTLPGGTLQIEWSEEDGHVYLTGPATFVYDGVWLQDDLQK